MLCELQGSPRREAANRLGIPEGTLSSRLATARKLLARRLSRHGVTLPSVGSAIGLGLVPTVGAVPPGLLKSTLDVAKLMAAGTVSPIPSVVLMTGVLKTMTLSKLKIGASIALLVAILAGGTKVMLSHASNPGPSNTEPANAMVDKPKATDDRDAIQGTWDVIKSPTYSSCKSGWRRNFTCTTASNLSAERAVEM